MPSEIKPVLRRIRRWEECQCGASRAYRFQISHLNCLLVQCGIGTKRAAQATESLLAEWCPQRLISFGVSGGLQDEVNVGDIVFISQACRLENGSVCAPMALASLPSGAKQAAAQLLTSRAVCWDEGRTITTKGSQIVPLELGERVHPVLDMETSAIAEAAATAGIPLLSLRSISDNPKEPLPFRIEDWFNQEDNLVFRKIVLDILRQPRILPRLVKVNQNTNLAAENLAMALLAILSQI